MRAPLTSALIAAITIVVLIPALPQRAEAGTGVLRCQMADGTTVYTSKACAALGATSTPLAAHVQARIARDQRREIKMTRMPADAAFLENLVVAHTDALPARRPLASGCADTPQQLMLDFEASVALRDINRIAESFDWVGMDNQQAQTIMARLGQLANRTLHESQYFDVSIGAGGLYSDVGNSAGAASSAGQLQVTFDAGNGASIVDFDVRQYKGCFFLRY